MPAARICRTPGSRKGVDDCPPTLPAISPRPEDYRITLFGVLGEVFPGTGRDYEVAIGAQVRDLRLSGGT